MPTLDRNGVSIYYEVHGQGPAILLTHGYSATSQMWRGQIEALSREHTLILWDMRGHGQSDSPDDPALYGEPQTIVDMEALLDAAGAETAIIGGLSLGGYMSLAFHLKNPERTRALLIIDTGPGFKNDAAREEWNRTAQKTAERFETEGLSSLARQSPERARATHRSAKGLVLAARHMLTQRDADVITALPDVGVPALVVVGANDTPFLKAADYMAAKIPGARKVLIAGAGHAANIDQPSAFNAAILEFLSTLKD